MWSGHQIHKSALSREGFNVDKKFIVNAFVQKNRVLEGVILQNWAGSYDKDAEACDRNLNLQPERFSSEQDPKTKMCFDYHHGLLGRSYDRRAEALDRNVNL